MALYLLCQEGTDRVALVNGVISFFFCVQMLVWSSQIWRLMFFMNWAVVWSSSLDPHSLSWKSAPEGHRCVLSSVWVGQFCRMCSGSWTPNPHGHSWCGFRFFSSSIVEDRAYRHRARFENRRRLEDDWEKAAGAKRCRDLEDRLLGLESGQLLHEQCDKYHHCGQCKRRLDHCGESNIWRESRYVPGCRIMVWWGPVLGPGLSSGPMVAA